MEEKQNIIELTEAEILAALRIVLKRPYALGRTGQSPD